jgi:hypothetical protein
VASLPLAVGGRRAMVQDWSTRKHLHDLLELAMNRTKEGESVLVEFVREVTMEMIKEKKG